MKEIKVGIIDYGLGNIFSLMNSFNYLGVNCFLIEESSQFSEASHLLLPGVGAYRDANLALKRAKLRKPLITAVKNNVPTLGICLGMQLLFSASLEGGESPGLELITGNVERLKPTDQSKVPHVQWNNVQYVGKDSESKKIINGNYFYFGHSYANVNIFSSNFDEYGVTEYGGQTFVSYARKANLMMTQFHPEKSGNIGLKFLTKFLGE